MALGLWIWSIKDKGDTKERSYGYDRLTGEKHTSMVKVSKGRALHAETTCKRERIGSNRDISIA